eukprot:155545-Pleurochrysis_carterae.AAC.1
MSADDATRYMHQRLHAGATRVYDYCRHSPPMLLRPWLETASTGAKRALRRTPPVCHTQRRTTANRTQDASSMQTLPGPSCDHTTADTSTLCSSSTTTR